MRRPVFVEWQPVHVTLRVDMVAVGRLRSRDAYHAIRKAMQAMLGREDFRIVHASLEADHIHLIVEAANDLALDRGMRAFMISAARRLNAQAGYTQGRRARLVRDAQGRQRAIGAIRPGRRGPVFVGRYHVVSIDSKYQARNAIRYVLNNFRHHDEIENGSWDVDYYSSGPSFCGWSEYSTSSRPFRTFPSYHPLPVRTPRTWLLATGWRHAGPISLHDIPSTMPFQGRLLPLH